MTIDERLLPCPFCGGTAALSKRSFHAYCIKCGAEGARTIGDEGAINLWNGRQQYVNGSTRDEIIEECADAIEGSLKERQPAAFYADVVRALKRRDISNARLSEK